MYQKILKIIVSGEDAVAAGEESGGVFRRRASDQTEASTIMLMLDDVAAYNYRFRHTR
jgi:hypothetical protein